MSFAPRRCQKHLRQPMKSGCINSRSRETLSNSTIRQCTGSFKLSLSIHLDGCGLNPMMPRRMEELHTWHGQHIIMAKGNLVNVQRSQKRGSTKFTIKMSAA
jgi:hypothetical protein